MTVGELAPRDGLPLEEASPELTISFGISLPKRIRTNAEIESWEVRTPGGNVLTASSIANRTGVLQRYVAEDETPLSMGLVAAKSALKKRGCIDTVLVSSSYPQGVNLADETRKALNLSADTEIEIGAACSGFVYGLTYLKKNEQRFKDKKILFVSTEKYSPTLADLRTDGTEVDPSLAQTIFSDGAVAMVFTYGKDVEVLSYVNYQFPEDVSQCLRMPIDSALIRYPYLEQPVPQSISGKFEQDGAKVYTAVRDSIPALVKKAVEDAGLSSSDIDLVIPHQGSKRVVEGLSKQLPDYAFSYDMADGNFSSASIPKALMLAIDRGDVKRGGTVVLAGFGAGLFASVAVVRLG